MDCGEQEDGDTNTSAFRVSFYTFWYHVDIFPGFYLLISVTPKYVKGTWLRYHEPKEQKGK